MLAWGFTFRDMDHMAKFLESDTYKAYEEELRAKQGIRILAKAPAQPRVLFIKKPVASAADLADVKMRVPEIRTYLLLWQTLGTKPARVAWGEVFLGLKTGVIDAAEGPVSRRSPQNSIRPRPSSYAPTTSSPPTRSRSTTRHSRLCRPTSRRSWSTLRRRR